MCGRKDFEDIIMYKPEKIVDTMKRNMISAALAAATVLGVIGCCGTKEVKFETVDEKAAYALVEGGRDSVKIDISLQFPTEGLKTEAVEGIRDGIVRDAFGEQFCGMTAHEAVQGYIDETVRNYRDANLEFVDQVAKNPEDREEGEWDIFTWDFTVEGRMESDYNGILSYSLTKYSYTGGAHGGTALLGLNFRKETGEAVTEDDIFAFGYEERLSAALRAHLKSSLDKDSYDMLFTTDITPNGNFILSKAGITYIYGQYEIGPYAIGIIKVTVPWGELQDILK